MRKVLVKLAVVSSLVLIPSFVCYASDRGTTAANFLKIGVGAKAAAMGGAFTALADDGTALYWNPAGLAQIKKTEILAMYNKWFQEVKQGYLSLAFPLLGGTIGLGANYVDMGQIEGRDEEGNPTGEFGASDIYAFLGYANRVYSNVMFGISAGMLQETIAGDKRSTYLGSIGLLFTGRSFSLGLACQNIGSNLGEDPLPLTYRGGIAIRLGAFRIAADAVKVVDDDMYYCAGLEWWMGSILALRAGYKTGQDIGSGMSAGIGFKISRININYAYVPYGDFGDTHRLSLSIRF